MSCADAAMTAVAVQAMRRATAGRDTLAAAPAVSSSKKLKANYDLHAPP
jgi:hypothetical protein